ncbi:oxygenase MpaB family protein [Hansschlegelia sp. KR7-227]|uniref:oxygenase MpaB family protein n=1 Tax=Hansschlegelia sp. KR7-227 TaxID=3400914 RepID=UPI003C0F3002
MQNIRRAIKQQVLGTVGSSSDAKPRARPPGDDGLFGPGSVAWRVHGDVTSMMIGGVSSLLIQMLHPGALAGVWDHSNFRGDMAGRLRRTARFISATTYGSTDEALGSIGRVRSIHERVRGVLPDGSAYSANDPALLTWVHVAEVRCFLAAYLRYRDGGLSAADQDRYFAETAIVARHLGATAIPTTREEAEAYLRTMRPQLRWDARTRRVASALLSQPASGASFRPVSSLMVDAGVDLLPDWAAEMHGFRQPPGRRKVVRAGAMGVGSVVRWALRADAAPSGA